MAQTDNSYLADKVMLRARHLPPVDPVRVLDCYAGEGVVWRHVRQVTGRDIRTTGIDVRDLGYLLPGDNRAYLMSMDLNRFDVIDLDAYGVPFEQIQIVAERGFQGVLFITFIQSLYGGLPSSLLSALGYSPEMVEKIPTIFYRDGWDKLKRYLAKLGAKQVVHRSHDKKHYLMVNGAELSVKGYGSQEAGRVANLF